MRTAMISARRIIDVIRPIKIATGRGENRFKCLITANELGQSGRLSRCNFALETVVFINDIIDCEPTSILF